MTTTDYLQTSPSQHFSPNALVCLNTKNRNRQYILLYLLQPRSHACDSTTQLVRKYVFAEFDSEQHEHAQKLDRMKNALK